MKCRYANTRSEGEAVTLKVQGQEPLDVAPDSYVDINCAGSDSMEGRGESGELLFRGTAADLLWSGTLKIEEHR